MILRDATVADLELLRYWDQQPHIIAATLDDDWQWEIELPRHPVWREQLIAESEGRPIGFIQIINPKLEETHYWGNCLAENCLAENKDDDYRAIDIWIGEPEDLGKGYGTKMMELAIVRCFSCDTVTSILVDPMPSNIKAREFYEKLGFEFIENRILGDDEDECAVYQLTRKQVCGS